MMWLSFLAELNDYLDEGKIDQFNEVDIKIIQEILERGMKND